MVFVRDARQQEEGLEVGRAVVLLVLERLGRPVNRAMDSWQRIRPGLRWIYRGAFPVRRFDLLSQRVAQRFAHRMGKPVRWVTIGKKGRDSLIRSGANVVAEFSTFGGDPTIADIAPASRLAIDEFAKIETQRKFTRRFCPFKRGNAHRAQ